MKEPVLRSRLQALRNSLTAVKASLTSTAWRPESTGTDARDELLMPPLWKGLEETLIKRINAQVANLSAQELALESAGNEDALRKAWDQYNKNMRTSKNMLRECFEIINALAIRKQGLDQGILYVAGELIRDCIYLSTLETKYYLLVASGIVDTFSKTTARIIRLRFPEWTLWDMPLAAHELGHVIFIEELDREKAEQDDSKEDYDESLSKMTSFLESQRNEMLRKDAELGDMLHRALEQDKKANNELRKGTNADEVRALAESRIRMLAADIFATYTMGPSYACSAIMLRFSGSRRALRDIPADAQRAHVVLSTLRWLNKESLKDDKICQNEVITRLEGFWNTTLSRTESTPSSRLTSDEEQYLDAFVESFIDDACRYALQVTAKYPRDGWLRAVEWAAVWLDQLGGGDEPSVPDRQSGKLRDVLNAAWLCRLQSDPWDDKRQQRLTRVGQALCNEIIKADNAPQSGSKIPSVSTSAGVSR